MNSSSTGSDQSVSRVPGSETDFSSVDLCGFEVHVVRRQAITRIVGQVYASVPPQEQIILVEKLLKPLGVLSLATVANGIFLKTKFLNCSKGSGVTLDQIEKIRPTEVMELTNRVQQVDAETIDAIARTIKASPSMASCPAAATLAKIPLRRCRSRHAESPMP